MNRYLLLLITILLFSCEKEKETKTFGETEYYFDERLCSISMGENGTFWVGSETGGLFSFKDNYRVSYDLTEDRIYKVMSDVDSAGDSILWIGVRNSGLQVWKKKNGTELKKVKTYAIDVKGNKYSPYDLLKLGDKIFIGASQGLFYLDLKADIDSLNLIYSSEEYLRGQENNTYIFHNLQNYKDSLLLGASQDGLLFYDLQKETQQFHLRGKHIEHVSVYNDTIFTVTNENLYLLDNKGEVISKIEADNSPRVYYRINGVHYIVGSDEIMLSKDLEEFVKIQLRRFVPMHCRNIILPDTVNNFTYLATENAVWRIPNNIDVFKGNKSIKVSCFDNGKTYFLTHENELYMQPVGDKHAKWIYTFSKDNIINWMQVIGNDLYVCNVDNVFQKITVTDNWLRNTVLSSVKEVYHSKARITSASIKKMNDETLAFLGTQDGLVSINKNGKADTIPELYGMYITSMFGHDYSGRIYISTLNNGVFYINQNNTIKTLPETSNRYFIRDIIATNDHNSNLIMLTNQQIISQKPYDSIRVKGYQKLLYINDTLFYALPESGLHKYVISNGKIQNAGTFYNDIRFNRNSVFFSKNTISLGSGIGVLNLPLHNKNTRYWTDFEQALNINILFAVLMGGFIIALAAIVLIIFLKKNSAPRIHIRKQKDDLSKRINDLLSYSYILEKEDTDKIIKIKNLISDFNLRSRNIEQVKSQLDDYSLQLAQINREIGLLLPQRLDYQAKEIASIDVYETQDILDRLQEAKSTNNIQKINERIIQNIVWIEQRDKLISNLQNTLLSISGWVEIDNFNKGIYEKVAAIKDSLKYKPIDDLTNSFTIVQNEISKVNSKESVSVIEEYTNNMLSYLAGKITEDAGLAFLNDSLNELITKRPQYDNIAYLKALKPLQEQIEIMKSLDKIRNLASDYKEQHDRIVRENDKQINKRFDKELSNYISDLTKDIIHTINSEIDDLYDKLICTDKEIVVDVLKLANAQGQHAKVLAILISDLNSFPVCLAYMGISILLSAD